MTPLQSLDQRPALSSSHSYVASSNVLPESEDASFLLDLEPVDTPACTSKLTKNDSLSYGLLALLHHLLLRPLS